MNEKRLPTTEEGSPGWRAFPGGKRRAAALRSDELLRAAQSVAEAEVRSFATHGDAPLTSEQEFDGPGLSWERAFAWLTFAREQRHEDPEKVLLAAVLAEGCAKRIPSGDYPQGSLGDLRAEIWSEIGNARRLLGQFAEAESAFGFVLDQLRAGSGSAELLIRSTDMLALTLLDSRRFDEAVQLYSAIELFYLEQGRFAEAGLIKLELASISGYRGDNTRAVFLLLEALPLLSREDGPEASLFALHNMMGRMVDLGRFEFAEEMMQTLRPHLEAHFGETGRLKLAWIEAKIAAGLERWSIAEHNFLSVRQSFAAIGMHYHMALVTLDYSALLLRLGRIQELRPLVDELIAGFLGLGIKREALASIILLQNALAAERVALTLL